MSFQEDLVLLANDIFCKNTKNIQFWKISVYFFKKRVYNLFITVFIGVFNLTKFIHFIGIGGISMSGIAKILLSNNIEVSGSDISESESVRELRELGARVEIGHRAENITNQDIVVYTSAVHDDNPEIIAAKQKGIKLIDRATMLGYIMKDYTDAISVAGTHGKTTATSMMAYVLLEAQKDPTVMVGGKLDGIDGNLRIGGSGYFLTETCEYMRNFLKFFPKIAIILNVEEDHLDYYRDIDDIVDAFSSFCALVPEDGYVVVNKESEYAVKSANGSKAKVYTFGFNDADYCAKNITYSDYGYPSFDVYEKDNLIGSISLNVVGVHNVLNALSVAAAALNMGIDFESIKKGLEKYTGTKRRFEKKGFVNGALVIDDYAHHPTEIKATLKALDNIKHQRQWVIFQPHTYTRTISLLDDFADALSLSDNVIITDIFAAREKDTGIVHSKDLASKIKDAIYIKDFCDIEKYIKENAKEGDVVLTVGAGDVYKIGESLCK
jgi:UDP-N-acetylmuramate--alanine ligase